MNTSYQKLFFENLRNFIPSEMGLAEAVGNVLNMSTASTYRRINCQTFLSLDEAVALSKAFNMPITGFDSGAKNIVGFVANELSPNKDSFYAYIQGLGKDIDTILKIENSSILYAAEDIPVFYHFISKPLAYFKMFYWMKAIQNVENTANLYYSTEMFGEYYEEEMTKIFETYSKIPTTEIWTEETILSSLRQIHFFYDSGFIPKKEDAIMLCEEIRIVVNHVKKQSELGEKILGNNTQTGKPFRFYISDLMIGTNCVLCKLGNTRVSYLSYNTFNSMKTSNNFFADQTESWLNNLLSKSLMASGSAEKQRNIFFKNLFSHIDKLIHTIELS